MIVLKTLSWSNCFSYGENNSIKLDDVPLVQLVGPNGSGKTTIAILIQEVLFGKNVKGIKKQSIENNKSGIKGYSISLDFSKDSDEYRVELDRKSSLKLKLYKNGVDVSSHTSMNTYKSISEILGTSDFKVFSQLIYQYSTDSLDFLTATDTNRKKFLISLLRLDKYIKLEQIFKESAKEYNVKLDKITGSLITLEGMKAELENTNTQKLDRESPPELDDALVEKVVTLKNKINNIRTINLKVNKNIENKERLDSLNPDLYMSAPPTPHNKDLSTLRDTISVCRDGVTREKTVLSKLKNATGTCHSCMQDIDIELRNSMISKIEKNIEEYTEKGNRAKEDLLVFETIDKKATTIRLEKDKFEKYKASIDDSVGFKLLNINDLSDELKNTELIINNTKQQISSINTKNKKVDEHNSRIEFIKEQLVKVVNDINKKSVQFIEAENKVIVLDVLKKVFSTNGLVSYKIESSVKELEKKINNYLIQITNFQIYFKLSGDKLNIEVIDDENNITDIGNLSAGEISKVNIACILAIRSIMAIVAGTEINFLFLDEIISVIDTEGKEQLAELLLSQNLNTFIVGHDWSHPLVDKIEVQKVNKISSIGVR